MATLTNLYLYLARLDKTGVRILAVLQSRPLATAIRLQDISTLNLPASWENKIGQIIYDNRMEWEPWVQTADDFTTLRAALRSRGYTNLPVSGQPEFTASVTQTVNVSYLPQVKTMLRKATFGA
jgi:hypothetical protein